jgi:hypothetical protein
LLAPELPPGSTPGFVAELGWLAPGNVDELGWSMLPGAAGVEPGAGMVPVVPPVAPGVELGVAVPGAAAGGAVVVPVPGAVVSGCAGAGGALDGDGSCVLPGTSGLFEGAGVAGSVVAAPGVTLLLLSTALAPNGLR